MYFKEWLIRCCAVRVEFDIVNMVCVEFCYVYITRSILIADKNNDSIHILDQNGKFLRFINSSNCDLKEPFRLCIGNNDYLFVAEWSSNIVKKIRYHANSGMVWIVEWCGRLAVLINFHGLLLVLCCVGVQNTFLMNKVNY